LNTDLADQVQARKKALLALFTGRGYADELQKAIDTGNGEWTLTVIKKQFSQIHDPIQQRRFLRECGRLFPDLVANSAWYQNLVNVFRFVGDEHVADSAQTDEREDEFSVEPLPDAEKDRKPPPGEREPERILKGADDADEFEVSPDYLTVRYRGEEIILTRNQSQMLKVLHGAYLSGFPDVEKLKLLAAIDNEESQVKDSWKSSPLWRTLIVSKRKGVYRLDLPSKRKANQK
jgi:hypothetical protein